MSENAVEKKKRTPRPTNLTRATVYQCTDGKQFEDKKLANAHQKVLDLTQIFDENPIAEGISAADLYEYVKQYKSQFFAVLRSLGKEE